MINNYSNIESLFSELDGVLEENIDVYMIGGGVLMKYKLRSETKDIDIIVSRNEEFEALVDAFLSLGFNKQTPESMVYGRMALSHILVRDDFRIDLFCKLVCGKFALSERMMERASLDVSLNKVRLLLCSLNDIFLFKSMTERDGDLIDCQNIATSHVLDWDAILDESVKQSVEDHCVWITWITSRMEELSERGVNIPILKKMMSLSDECLQKLENEFTKGSELR